MAHLQASVVTKEVQLNLLSYDIFHIIFSHLAVGSHSLDDTSLLCHIDQAGKLPSTQYIARK